MKNKMFIFVILIMFFTFSCEEKKYVKYSNLEILDEEGGLLELVPYEVGFRRIELINKLMYLNGKRLVLVGVNRHEWSPKTGRCIGHQDSERR